MLDLSLNHSDSKIKFHSYLLNKKILIKTGKFVKKKNYLCKTKVYNNQGSNTFGMNLV